MSLRELVKTTILEQDPPYGRVVRKTINPNPGLVTMTPLRSDWC